MAHVLDFWPNLIDAICFTHPPSENPETDELRGHSSDSRCCRNRVDSSSIPHCSFKRSGLPRILCLDAKDARVV